MFEKQLRENGLLAKHPLVFLALFDDRDPETVLTGAAAYTLAQFYGDVKPQDLDQATKDKIAAAVREKLLTHRDVRVRATAIAILGDTKWMMPDDIAKGLDDQTNEVRIATVSWISTVRSKWSWESDPDNKEEPNSPTRLTRDQFRERDAQLAEILLNHLNDTHYYIRENVADVLRYHLHATRQRMAGREPHQETDRETRELRLGPIRVAKARDDPEDVGELVEAEWGSQAGPQGSLIAASNSVDIGTWWTPRPSHLRVHIVHDVHRARSSRRPSLMQALPSRESVERVFGDVEDAPAAGAVRDTGGTPSGVMGTRMGIVSSGV